MPKIHEFHLACKRALADVSPRVVTLDETGSTNDDARALARAGAPHLTVVISDAQTAGRGRLGRTWMSERGAGLFTSWVVRPSLSTDRWTVIPLLAGVAAVEAVRARTGVPASLKWPNDLVVVGRKLGGILVEAELPEFCIVGLGVNVGHTSFPPEIADGATSIAREGGLRLDRPDLCATALRGFAKALDDPQGSLERYRELCVTLGQHVRVERANAEPVLGVARTVDDDGALVLDNGARIASGDVVHLRPV